MNFDPDLTRRVRALILEAGRTSPGAVDPRLVDVEPDACSPEMRAILHRVAPMAEVLFLIMSASGVNSVEEHVALRGAVRTMTDSALASPTIDAMLARFSESLMDEGFEGRFATVAAQLAADRADSEVAIELAAAMITVDGAVDPRERDALEELALQTGNDPDAIVSLLQ